MPGDEIKFLAEIRKRSLPLDTADHARHAEQFGGCAEQWFAIGVEPEDGMPEIFADVEKVACARAEIENPQRRRAVEPEVLRALDVDVDPINDVFEPIDLGRAWPIRVLVTQVSEFQPIDAIQDLALVDWMQQPAEMFGRAGKGIAGKQLLKLP